MNQMALIKTGNRHYDDALDLLYKCIEQAPKYLSSYVNIGIIYKLQSNYKEAVHWFLKALQIKLNNTMLMNHIGDIFDLLQYKFNDIDSLLLTFSLPKDFFYLYLGKSYSLR